MTPEESARQKTDAMLTASGWTVQSKEKINLSASRGAMQFIRLAFRRAELHKHAAGSSLLFVNQQMLNGTIIALPLQPEQTRSVEEVERCSIVEEELEAVVCTSLQRAARLRQLILTKAFSGEL